MSIVVAGFCWACLATALLKKGKVVSIGHNSVSVRQPERSRDEGRRRKARQQRTQQPAKPNPTHRHPSFLQLKTAWIQSLGLPMTEEVRLFRCLGATFCLEMVRTKASIRFMVVVGSWDGINL